jgi:hypothetical protein
VRSQIEGNFASKLKNYTAPTVLVIDDIGLLPIGGTDGAAVFFHVANTWYEKRHPNDSRDQPRTARGEIFGDAVVAAAILDRLMHKPSCSTSAVDPGGYGNTTASRSPTPTTTANLPPPTRTFASTARTGEHKTRLLPSAHRRGGRRALDAA